MTKNQTVEIPGLLWAGLTSGRPELIGTFADQLRNGTETLTATQMAGILDQVADVLLWKRQVDQIMRRLDNLRGEARGFVNVIEEVQDAVRGTYTDDSDE